MQIQRRWIPHDVRDGEIHMHQGSAISRIEEGVHLRVGISDVSSSNIKWYQQDWATTWSYFLWILNENEMLTFQNSAKYSMWAFERSLKPIWLSWIQTPVTTTLWQETSMFTETWKIWTLDAFRSFWVFSKWNFMKLIRNSWGSLYEPG